MASFTSVQRSLIFDTKTKQSFYEKPKTKTSIRRIDIDVDLKHYLRSMKENQLSIFNEVDDDSPVFRYLDGNPFNNQSVSQGIKKGLQKMGRGDCSMHSLRHSHASALLSADAPLKVVSDTFCIKTSDPTSKSLIPLFIVTVAILDSLPDI